ncbi:hypothetical protein [Streptomyces axinellae]|uniref:Uncharacterized protein n=1 Tax=Streptomyces axinellae TaxID=552788 RepID=A0ABP6C8D4_9ACTN
MGPSHDDGLLADQEGSDMSASDTQEQIRELRKQIRAKQGDWGPPPQEGPPRLMPGAFPDSGPPLPTFSDSDGQELPAPESPPHNPQPNPGPSSRRSAARSPHSHGSGDGGLYEAAASTSPAASRDIVVALAEEALAHQDRLPRKQPSPYASSVDTASDFSAPPRPNVPPELAAAVAPIPQDARSPWYQPATETWHHLVGSTLVTSARDAAKHSWKWVEDHPDHVSAAVSGTAFASLAIGGFANPPATEQVRNWATFVRGLGGISLGSALSAIQLWQTKDPTRAQQALAALNMVGQGVYGVGVANAVKSTTISWAFSNGGAALSAVGATLYPWMGRQQQEPVLPYTNQDAAAANVRLGSSQHLPQSGVRQDVPLADLPRPDSPRANSPSPAYRQDFTRPESPLLRDIPAPDPGDPGRPSAPVPPPPGGANQLASAFNSHRPARARSASDPGLGTSPTSTANTRYQTASPNRPPNRQPDQQRRQSPRRGPG